MEEEKTSKKTIVVLIVLFSFLLVYLLISRDWFGIKSRYFWGDKIGDLGEIISFYVDDWDIYDNNSYDYWYQSNWWYQRENVSDSMIPVVKNKNYYYADDYDNPPLSSVMKSMWLRATYCPYVFCQSANDSWAYVNLKHYYWDEHNEKMILITGVYYVSDCSYYDDLFKQGKLQ